MVSLGALSVPRCCLLVLHFTFPVRCSLYRPSLQFLFYSLPLSIIFFVCPSPSISLLPLPSIFYFLTLPLTLFCPCCILFFVPPLLSKTRISVLVCLFNSPFSLSASAPCFALALSSLYINPSAPFFVWLFTYYSKIYPSLPLSLSTNTPRSKNNPFEKNTYSSLRLTIHMLSQNCLPQIVLALVLLTGK